MDETSQQRLGLGFDPQILRNKYIEEREKRVRSDGLAQFRRASQAFPWMVEDLFDHTAPDREALTDEIDVLIVGGGMSGLMTAGALMKAGTKSLRIIERAADFGGVWYWNRYPGVQCDTESYVYLPWIEEVGFMPKEKYSKGKDIAGYLRQMGRHFGLYPQTCFKTKVDRFSWDEEASRWIVATDFGDRIRARFIILSPGTMIQPHLPAIEGVETFEGRSFLTARWDYGYTGGTPDDPSLTNLKDKNVAIIGTGCSAIQAVPHLANWSKHLYVFQRTPSMVNFRGQKPTDPEWAKNLRPGWQEDRMRNFEIAATIADPAAGDLVADGWTQLARNLTGTAAIRALVGNATSDAELMQLADYRTMEENRARVEKLVLDPTVAERLKPYYNVHCKRPAFHDEYLPAFNRENVTLVDTLGKGVEKITATGIVAGGKEVKVDTIIWATGFDAVSPTYRSGEYTVLGTNGVSLETKWNRGFRSLHGVFVNCFPNMALVGQIRDGAGSFNFAYPISIQAKHVAAVIERWLKEGVTRAESTVQAEENWAATVQDSLPPIQKFLAECTPGYLNGEGNANEPALRSSVYCGGVASYLEMLNAWREEGIHRDIMISKAE